MSKTLKRIGAIVILAGVCVVYFGQGCIDEKAKVIPLGEHGLLREILLPMDNQDLSQVYVKDHYNKPLDRFYLDVRYQTPDWNDFANSTPFRYPTSMNTSGNTGLGPWPQTNQFGPIGGGVDQSVFQVMGYEVGVLMRSWDSPHPMSGAQYPACRPNCNGAEKHTIYEYKWSQPPMAFTQATSATDNSVGVAVDAQLQVHQFEQWNIGTGGAPAGILAGQFAFVIFFDDPSGKKVQYVVMAYHSNPAHHDGGESTVLEPIGDGNNGYYISTSFLHSPSKLFVTLPSVEDGFMRVPWQNFRHFSAVVTPLNLYNAVQALNAKGGSLSLDILNYKISQVGLNQEVHYEEGDAYVMGASYRYFGVYERSLTAP